MGLNQSSFQSARLLLGMPLPQSSIHEAQIRFQPAEARMQNVTDTKTTLKKKSVAPLMSFKGTFAELVGSPSD